MLTPTRVQRNDCIDEHVNHGNHAPCIQIRRLVSGHYSTIRRRRWIVIMTGEPFQAMLDESGYAASDPNHPNDVFVFAGYVGTVKDWEDFTHAWEPILDAEPELRDARFVKKLVRWQGRWSDPRAVKLMKVVTDNRDLGSIRWRLPYRDYRSVVLTNAMGGDENLYFFAWFGVLLELLGTIRANFPDATLDLFYDQNIEQESKVQAGYEKFHRFLQDKFPRNGEDAAAQTHTEE
jgi:hypothetical protein